MQSHREWCLKETTCICTREKRVQSIEARTRSRSEGVGRAEHDTAGLDGVKALPDHRDDGASSHVLDEAGEEGLALEVSVVCTYVTVISEAPSM